METSDIRGDSPVGVLDDVRSARANYEQGRARIGLECIDDGVKDDSKSLIRVSKSLCQRLRSCFRRPPALAPKARIAMLDVRSCRSQGILGLRDPAPPPGLAVVHL